MKNRFSLVFFLRKFLSLQAGFFLILVLPASTNYQLKDFGFGSGGVGNATSGSYALDAVSGEQSNGNLSSTNYGVGSGLIFTNQANVPPAPTFTNPSNYYNKLKVVLDNGGNPSDTKFSIAISTDNFATDTRYMQSDNTVGTVRGIEDYQTYTVWGSTSGVFIIGLAPSTTYQVKVNAWQGKFTETAYGPTASASTVSPQVTLSMNINAINFGSLNSGIVTSGPQNIVVNFATNGESGGNIYMSGQNGGLLSSSSSHQINSLTGDLTASAEGFGAQGVSVTQSSGGPLTITSPYDVLTGDNVGIVNASVREIFATTGPVSGGQGTFLLKAKASSVTPSAGDYSETLTVIASARF
ncbi:MAG: hypothetical protein AUK58_04065 [Candidatus Moranbacteria bacterium CG2_30_41_165]|nr:MAG: hypothetical protein AUK58_04065 [Candidatus Moranbacteria bacterium CG2_30_41_165]PIV86319.1 MAG: hypothetical protein COW50_02060 [Candidatus Moranbacteria bacterium CG17_big_fil_post_rev_8_21_14_2_50_41_107]